MLKIEIQNKTLAEQIIELLDKQFGNDADKMLQELLENYLRQQNRLQFSGILTWEKDGLAYQKEIRHEWH